MTRIMIVEERGGKQFAKGVILSWLNGTGGSNLKLLETATGLPQKLLSRLLADLMEERVIRLNKAIFQVKK